MRTVRFGEVGATVFDFLRPRRACSVQCDVSVSSGGGFGRFGMRFGRMLPARTLIYLLRSERLLAIRKLFYPDFYVQVLFAPFLCLFV